MPDTELPTINSYYDNKTDQEYALEDTAARARAEAAIDIANEAKDAAGDGITTDPLWVQHRNTFRGEYLGETTTEEQSAAIQANTFDNLYVGDFWTRNGVDYIIADINYWMKTGDIECTTPHLAIVPRKSLYTAPMNDSDTSTGGYLGTKMRSTGLNNAKTMIYSAFGEENILDHRDLFTNTVQNGFATAGAWADSKVDLMNQIMVYGSVILRPTPTAGSTPHEYTPDKVQLSLFRLRPELITDTENDYSLRDVVSAKSFAFVGKTGAADGYFASVARGVRPAFGLIG